jgi:hypothetical protein
MIVILVNERIAIMIIELYKFPLNDIHAIDVKLEELQAQKKVRQLVPEEQDWMDWAMAKMAEAERAHYCL